MVPWSSQQRPTGRAAASVVGIAAARQSAASSSNNNNNNNGNTTSATMEIMSAPPINTLNGPDSPPVVFNPYSSAGAGAGAAAGANTASTADWDYDDEDERCRSCHVAALYTDRSQGDRVCTNCGVVAEGHLREVRPEWKDFNEAEDLVKGLPSGARSGLVAVDESKYLGGLQPTTLSKQAFGGDSHGGYGMAQIRKRLKSTNKRLDHMMEKIHSKALNEAKLDRRIRLKRSRNQLEHNNDYGDGDENGDDSSLSIRPELEHVVLQEEEDAHRLHTALYAEKWSLDRALLLYGQAHEQREVTEEEREDLMGKLDSTLRKASNDLYNAYSMLSQAATALELPERVLTESTHRLVRFVTRRDGIRVPGVASRLSSNSAGGSGAEADVNTKELEKQLKEYNLRKQMAAVGGALLFLTARSLGWTRSIAEICSSFTNSPILQEQGTTANSSKKTSAPAPLIKAKHVSRAMKEIQSVFPEYSKHQRHIVAVAAATPSSSATNTAAATASSSTIILQDAVATANFSDHSLRKLQLPPVAEASIRTLLMQLRDEQLTLGRYSGTKLSTLCASLAYLMCSAGSVMQRLAQQHRETLLVHKHNSMNNIIISSSSSKPSSASSPGAAPPPRKKQKGNIELKVGKHTSNVGSSSSTTSDSDDEDDELLLGRKKGSTGSNGRLKTDDDDDVPFDVFSHTAIVGDQTEKEEYEMKRMWDAWAEQISWARSIVDVEQSCGVSRNVIHEFYKKELYPRRAELLDRLAVSVQKQPPPSCASSSNSRQQRNDSLLLQEAPLAPILLAHIATAGAVMSSR